MPAKAAAAVARRARSHCGPSSAAEASEVKVISVGSFRSPSAQCGRRGQGRSSLPALPVASQGARPLGTGYGAGGGTGGSSAGGGGGGGRITGAGGGEGGATGTETTGLPGIDAFPVSTTCPVVGSTW